MALRFRSLSQDDHERRLRETIEKRLPDFVQTLRKQQSDGAGPVIFHQDSFAADYQEEEYRLLGMAIKYAGLYGIELRIIGHNRETLGQGKK